MTLLAAIAQRTAAGEPFIDPMFEVQAQEDIVFGTGAIGNPVTGEIPPVLDLYTPVGAEFTKPGMILLYGGGFEDRRLDQMQPLAQTFASRGWAVATADYRIIGDDPTYEPGPFGADAESNPLLRAMHAAFNDAAKALAWMSENSDQLAVDPQRMVIGGAYSGAIAALFEGYRNDSAAAIVSFSGGMYGFESLIEAGGPPAVLIHGTEDTLVPFALAEAIVARAESVGVPTAFLPFESGNHGQEFFESPDLGPTTFAFINEFLIEQLNLSEIELSPHLSGDYNNNGAVEQADLDLVLLHWGADATAVPEEWINDLPEGLIDQDELDPVLLNWGKTEGAALGSTSVPEPCTATVGLVLVTVASVALVLRRIR